MEPQEIFELIVKADEKLKYATPARGDQRARQAADLLQEAIREAEAIGNDALVQQAKVRLADLEALMSGTGRPRSLDRPIRVPRPLGPRGTAPRHPRKAPRSVARWASVSWSSVSIPVILMVSRNSSSTMWQPSHPFTCASTRSRISPPAHRRGTR